MGRVADIKIMTTRPHIDHATVREWFHYDPKSGALTWKKVRSNRVRVGQVAGTLHKTKSGKTYRVAKLKGYGHVRVHRLIWLWVTGHFPGGKEEIDHADGNGLNNRWSNLRLVSGQVDQQRNQRLRENNTSGIVGVGFAKREGKYRAHVRVRGRLHHLGYFSRIEDAIAARQAASAAHGFHPNHGQKRPL